MINKREIFQLEAGRLGEEHNNIILEFCTGAGKTGAFLRIIDLDSSGLHWYIVCPDILQVHNIKSEIKERGYAHLLDDKIADIICYASFKNLEGYRGNIVFDEGHHLSELKEDIAKTVKYKRIVVATATLPSTVRERVNNLGEFYTMKVSLSNAIKAGIIPKPKIYIHRIELDDTVDRKFIAWNKAAKCLTDKQIVSYYDEQIEYWKSRKHKEEIKGNNADWMETKIITFGLKRKSSIARFKTSKVRSLLCSLENKRYICFCGSVDQAIELGGDCAVYSLKGKKMNISTLEAFNNYEINTLFAYKMGKEGLNLEGIETGVIVQLPSGIDEGLEITQLIGRVLRAEMPEVHIFVAKDTIDEQYLSRALKTIDNQYIEYVKENQEQKEKQKKQTCE